MPCRVPDALPLRRSRQAPPPRRGRKEADHLHTRTKCVALVGQAGAAVPAAFARVCSILRPRDSIVKGLTM